VHVVGTVIAHIAKTAMYAPPVIGSSRPPLAPLWKLLTRRGRVVKALPYLSSLAQHSSPNETD